MNREEERQIVEAFGFAETLKKYWWIFTLFGAAVWLFFTQLVLPLRDIQMQITLLRSELTNFGSRIAAVEADVKELKGQLTKHVLKD